jgi:hypothetical protein
VATFGVSIAQSQPIEEFIVIIRYFPRPLPAKHTILERTP